MCDACEQEASAQLEHLHDIDAQLDMVDPHEAGALDVLKGIQVTRP